MASTIKDIRAETGLALSTISKYLNGGNVREENAVKIDEAIRKLDYHPNELARALITKQTRTVGVVVNDITSQFCGNMLRYAGEALRRRGYSAIICDSAQDTGQEEENIRFCLEKNVDGILLMPIASDAGFLEQARERKIPVVLLDREIGEEQIDSVTIDNREAAARGTRFLIENGHRRIGVIHSLEYTGQRRYEGFCEAMHRVGLDVPESVIYCARQHSVELGYEGMKALLAACPRPTAVFLSNYEVTLGAVMALNEEGLHCPEDISLLGFDELILSMVMKPEMTLLSQPMEDMCEEAAALLLERISGSCDLTGEAEGTKPRRRVLRAELKEGGSVMPVHSQHGDRE